MKKTLVLGLLLVGFVGCMKENTEPLPVELADNVVLPEQDSSVTEVIVDSNRIILVFSSNSTPNIRVGDIVVGTAGLGYLRKVRSAYISNDTMYLITEQASLSEVILSGEMDTSVVINPPSPRPQKIRIDTTIQTPSGTYRLLETGDPVIFVPQRSAYLYKFPNLDITIWHPDGDVAVQIHVDTLALSIGKEIDFHLLYDSGLKEFRWVLNSADSLAFQGLMVGLLQEVTGIDSIPLGPQPLFELPVHLFFAGIPIVVYLRFYLSAGLEALLSIESEGGITGAYGITARFSAGAEYNNGTWSTIWDKTLQGYADLNASPGVEISVYLEEFIGGNLKALVYGVLGPGIWAAPYVYQEVQYPPFTYEVGLGIGGGVDFSMFIFGQEVVDFSQTLADFHYPLIQGGGIEAPALISPPNNTVVHDTPALFLWHQVPGAVVYQIQIDEDPAFISPEVDQILEDTTLLIHEELQETQYYWRVRGKDDQDRWGAWSDIFHFQFSPYLLIFSEDFDSYEVGGNPSDTIWTIIEESPSGLEIVSPGFQGGKALKIFDPTPDTAYPYDGSYAAIYTYIPETYTFVDFYVFSDTISYDCGFRSVGDYSNYWGTMSWYIRFLHGEAYYYTGSYFVPLIDLVPGVWYKFHLVIDWDNEVYDIFVNDTYLATAPFAGSGNPGGEYIHFLEFNDSFDATPGFLIDEISLWEEPPTATKLWHTSTSFSLSPAELKLTPEHLREISKSQP